MFRNQYDNDISVFSPKGRLHQVEYALEAVQQGSAVVALRSATHAVLVAVKRNIGGPLGSFQKKLFKIDDHMGIGIAGLTSDARVLSTFMRSEAVRSKMLYDRPIPISRLASILGDKAQTNTQEYGGRPYGVGLLLIGHDQTGPHVFEASPTGNNYEYFAMSIGSRSQSARTYLEKHLESFSTATLNELILHGVRAIKETLQQDIEIKTENLCVAWVGEGAAECFKLVENEDTAEWVNQLKSETPTVVTEAMEVEPTVAE